MLQISRRHEHKRQGKLTAEKQKLTKRNLDVLHFYKFVTCSCHGMIEHFLKSGHTKISQLLIDQHGLL